MEATPAQEAHRDISDRLRKAKHDLFALHQFADNEKEVLTKARTKHLQEQIDEIRKTVEQEVDAEMRFQIHTTKARVEFLLTKRAETLAQMLAEKEEISSSSPLVGRKVVHDYRYPRKYGVVEVFREGDQVALTARYALPTRGDLVVRELNKDGSRSKVAHRLEEYEDGGVSLPWHWKFVKD